MVAFRDATQYKMFAHPLIAFNISLRGVQLMPYFHGKTP